MKYIYDFRNKPTNIAKIFLPLALKARTVAHFACKVRGAKMKVRRQLNSLHYSP